MQVSFAEFVDSHCLSLLPTSYLPGTEPSLVGGPGSHCLCRRPLHQHGQVHGAGEPVTRACNYSLLGVYLKITGFYPQFTEVYLKITGFYPQYTEVYLKITGFYPQLTEVYLKITGFYPQYTEVYLKITGFYPQLTEVYLKITGFYPQYTEVYLKITGFYPQLTEVYLKITGFYPQYVTVLQTAVLSWQMLGVGLHPAPNVWQGRETGLAQ